LAHQVKKDYGVKVAWYSGKNDLPQNVSTDHFDYIKIGRYVAELGPLDSLTTNQRMMKRLADGRVKDITEWFRRNKKVEIVENEP
jgi:anaerobic ribonucleoside-triphosphate reductase activating protein